MEFRAMRRFKQQLTKEECFEILRSAPRGVIAMNGENGYPYAVTINQYFDETEGRIYFHGALQGLKVDLLGKDNKVCFTTTDEGHIEEGEKIYDQLRRLAKRFYPSPESIEKEIESAGSRVKMYVMSIDHMTGKLVHEK